MFSPPYSRLEDIQRIQLNDATLHVFDLNLSYKDDNDVAVFATALRINTVVQELSINSCIAAFECGPQCKVTVNGWISIFGMLQVNRTIHTLAIIMANFDCDCAKLFATMVLSNPNTTIKSLTFKLIKEIGFNGVSVMVDALCNNPNGCSLTSLTLYGVFGRDGIAIEMQKELAKKFVTLLQKNSTKLKELVLTQNNLDDNFVIILANGIKYNTQLEVLDLNTNIIANIGAKEIATMLHFNRTLVRLDLSYNFIGNVGAIAITRAIRYNPTLHVLAIHSNYKLTKGGVAKATQLLQYNESLEQFFVWESDIISHPLCDAIQAPIQSVLDYNDTIQTFLIDDEDEYFPTLNSGHTAPKKGLRRRQDIYNWLSNDRVNYNVDLNTTTDNNSNSNSQDDDSDSDNTSSTYYTDDGSYFDIDN